MKFSAMIMAVLLFGCYPSPNDQTPDEQLVQVYLHHGYYDEINTFDQILQKDLIPGTIKIPFRFTRREQEIILTKAERIGFFDFPDTIYRRVDQILAPDFGPQRLRIKAPDKDKSVVWFNPLLTSFKRFPLLLELRNLILDITASKPEYKALPPAKSGYQ